MEPRTRLDLIPTNITAFTVFFSSILWAQHPFLDDDILFYLFLFLQFIHSLTANFSTHFDYYLRSETQYHHNILMTIGFSVPRSKKIYFYGDMLKLQKSSYDF